MIFVGLGFPKIVKTSCAAKGVGHATLRSMESLGLKTMSAVRFGGNLLESPWILTLRHDASASKIYPNISKQAMRFDVYMIGLQIRLQFSIQQSRSRTLRDLYHKISQGLTRQTR